MVSIHSDEENEAIMDLAKTNVYIGAESDGNGNWKWADGTGWWLPSADKRDELPGKSQTRIVMTTTNKWHGWGTGDDQEGVVCAKAPTATAITQTTAPPTTTTGTLPYMLCIC